MTAPAVVWPRVPRGYQDPPREAWERIRQRDFWREDLRTPPKWIPTPGELAWEPKTGVLVGPLGNNVSTASPPPWDAIAEGRNRRKAEGEAARRDSTRRLRYELRHATWQLSTSSNVCKCGRTRYLDSPVSIVQGGHGAHFTGLVRCGSVWECPVCMYRICATRAEEVRTLVARHRASGGSVYMLTLTLPHDQSDELHALRKTVARAWSYVQSGAPYKRIRALCGIVGTIRALEVTHGPNGWHPHLHVLVLTEHSLESPVTGLLGPLAERYKTLVYRRWVDAVTRRQPETFICYRAPSRERGISFVSSHKDEYIAKLGLADELTRGSWKKPRELQGYRTPLQILHSCARDPLGGTVRDRATWIEYAKEMRGARQLTWSRGLRDRYSLDPEQTDLEIVEQDGVDDVVVYTISTALWDRIVKKNWALQAELLHAAEVNGWDGVERVLDRVQNRQCVPF